VHRPELFVLARPVHFWPSSLSSKQGVIIPSNSMRVIRNGHYVIMFTVINIMASLSRASLQIMILLFIMASCCGH